MNFNNCATQIKFPVSIINFAQYAIDSGSF